MNTINLPPGNILCGDGLCDPYVRTSQNGLITAHCSTGQFLANCGENGGNGRRPIVFPANHEISLFNYGLRDTLPESSGFGLTKALATDDITTCEPDGKLSGRQQAFFAIGIAARLGRPRLYDAERAEDLFATWTDSYATTVRDILAETVSIKLVYDDVGMMYRLGSLLGKGGMTFGPVTGEPMSEELLSEKTCCKKFVYEDKIMASCKSDHGHSGMHRDGTILWNNDGQPTDKKAPQDFMPFKFACMISPIRNFSIRLKTGSRALVFEKTVSTGPLVMAVPVKVWLFGTEQIVPQGIMCGIPTSFPPTWARR